MQIKNSVALVTGASRGIGRSLVEALVAGGAKRVYATARSPSSLDALVALDPKRVVALALDVTSPTAAEAAAKAAPDVNLLFNNAGLLSAYSLLHTPVEVLRAELETNFFGPLNVTRAFAPGLEKAGGGAIVNVLTVVSLASMPGLGGYSATKAAALSMTQAIRGELRAKGIAVHAVFPGPVDTEMAKAITLPKTSPVDVAQAILAGVEANAEDILPDPMSQQVFAGWLKDPKALERQFGAM